MHELRRFFGTTPRRHDALHLGLVALLMLPACSRAQKAAEDTVDAKPADADVTIVEYSDSGEIKGPVTVEPVTKSDDAWLAHFAQDCDALALQSRYEYDIARTHIRIVAYVAAHCPGQANGHTMTGSHKLASRQVRMFHELTI